MKLLVLGMALISMPVMAKDVPMEPSSTPDWSQVRHETEALVTRDLADPNSAQIEWVHGFAWGYTREATLLPKRYGWIGCLRVNAKNRLGGYTGFNRVVVAVGEDGRVRLDTISHSNVCESFGPKTPLQAALVDQPVTAGSGSMADELTKLADLRDRGVLTAAEFDAQKTRLLATAR